MTPVVSAWCRHLLGLGGIFSGMFSPYNSQAVLSDLGDAVPKALARATSATRADFAEFRKAFPAWPAGMFERDIANLLHPRMWAHLEAELQDAEGVTLRSKEPYREIGIDTPSGRSYVARVKRHDENDKIRSYATHSDIQFWSGTQLTFEGFERFNLAIGYRWDRVAREIISPVISYRENKEEVVWAVEIMGGGVDATPLTYESIVPALPEVLHEPVDGEVAEPGGERNEAATS